MNSDNVKWLIAGLAGAFLAMCLLGAGAFLGIRYIITNLEAFDEPDPVYGPDQWREKETEYLEEEAEKQAALEESGLLERYAVVSLHDDTRAQLYQHRNFAEVEDRLTAQFDAADSPLKKHRYSQHIRHIGNLYYGEDPEAQWDVLSEWVETGPDVYHARLVRGAYATDYAWYFRGTTYANRVTDEGWGGFRRYLEFARQDLEAAREMNPGDAESASLLITVAAAQDGGLDSLENYFEQALKTNPLHHGARMAKLNFAQPKWGGSWADVEAVIANAEAHRDAFPLLAEVVRYGNYYMESRGETYENTWNSAATKQMMFEALRDQVALSPEDLRIFGDLASFAADCREFDVAYNAMETLGDRYPDNCRFSGLANFHRWRGIIGAEYSQYPDVAGTLREREILEQTLKLDPENTMVAGIYLGCLARQQDTNGARAFYENLKDPYLATGNWGDPPDFIVMEGMAKAGRSDDWGIQGSDSERPLLDEAITSAPDNAYVRLIYAEYHITRDEFDDAEVHLQKARELDPDYDPALHIMGWLHFHQKRWDEGIATAQDFLNTEPSSYLERYRDDALEIIELCEEKKAG